MRVRRCQQVERGGRRARTCCFFAFSSLVLSTCRPFWSSSSFADVKDVLFSFLFLLDFFFFFFLVLSVLLVFWLLVPRGEDSFPSSSSLSSSSSMGEEEFTGTSTDT